MFDRIEWSASEARVGDVVFDLASSGAAYPSEITAARPRLIKNQFLVSEYASIFASADIPERPRMLELGLWDGASAIFWSELLKPAIYIGIDLDTRGDSEVLRQYASPQHRIVTRWGVSQTDREALLSLVRAEDAAPLDLVVDDASHLYEPTKASFEILFPLLRAGGVYVIEDWAWAHWPRFQSPTHNWAFETPTTRLVCELVAVAGGGDEVIGGLTVFAGLVAVTHGPAILDESFSLKGVTTVRPRPSTLHRIGRFGHRATRKVMRSTRRVLPSTR